MNNPSIEIHGYDSLSLWVGREFAGIPPFYESLIMDWSVLLSEMPSLQDSITLCSCRLLYKMPSRDSDWKDINAGIMNLNCQKYKLKYIGIDDS